MKNIRQDADDSLRAEYKRSDFGEMVLGKHAAAPIEFAELVRILLACIGEDEGLKFFNEVSRNSNDWTYSIDEDNQITLRYWVNEFESIEERLSTQCCITTPEERATLQNQLLHHVSTWKVRAGAQS
jgi:hypothetical protein